MNTKTITSHDVYNYGASLQAYSLQQFLLENGHYNEIINYKPIYSRARYNFWYISPRYKFSTCKILWFPICLFLAPKRFKTISRKKRFDAFTKKYLRLTNCRFDNYKSLENADLKADAFIVGSDQVWNSDHVNGRDPANYLAFVHKGVRKLSYAASFGMDHINIGYENMVRDYLSTFEYITVRESHGLSILKNLGLRGEQVVDPTLLHNKAWWDKRCIVKSKEDYLLVYDFGQSKVIRDIAEKIATEKGLKIYSINDFTTHGYADLNISDAGPIDFISFIRGAKYFISNSFHGTIFSLLFEVPFLVVKRTKGNVNSRMESLLEMVNVNGRLVSDISEIENLQDIDFSKVKRAIEDNSKYSAKLLLSFLK